MDCVCCFLKDQSGATAVEYGLLAGLLILAILAGLTTLGTKLSNTFARIAAIN